MPLNNSPNQDLPNVLDTGTGSLVPPGGTGKGNGREVRQGSQEEKDEVLGEDRNVGLVAGEEAVAIKDSLS